MTSSTTEAEGRGFQSFLDIENDWEFDRFDDGSQKLVGKITLEKYGSFLREYSSQLKNIVEAVDDTLGEAWEAESDPIELHCTPMEQADFQDMLQSSSESVSRVLLVFATLIEEVRFLESEAEKKFFDALIFYGEGMPQSVSTAASGVDNQMAISTFLPLLKELNSFVSRCNVVAKNIICQMAYLYKPQSKGSKMVLDVSQIHFRPVVNSLSKLLTILITLDEIIDAQCTLREHWTLFKRMIKSVSMDPTKFNTTDADLKPFEKLLMMLEGRLLDGMIFQNCVEQVFDDVLDSSLSKNTVLAEEIMTDIKRIFQDYETRPNSSKELLGVCGLFVLHFQIFRQMDKKFFKQLWDSHRRFPGATAWGNVFFLPNEFLLAKLPQFHSVLDKKAKSQLLTNRDTYIQNKVNMLAKETQMLHFQISTWMIHMERNLGTSSEEAAIKSETPLTEQLEERGDLLLRGLNHARILGHGIRTTMNMFVTLSRPMTKATVLSLCRLLELLKAVQYTYHRYSLQIHKSLNHVIRHLTMQTTSIVTKALTRAKSEKRISQRNSEALAALEILDTLLKDGVKGTDKRKTVVALTTSILQNSKHVKDEEMNQLLNIISWIESTSTIFFHVREACDCAFMYWHRAIFPVYLVDIFHSGAEGNGSADAYRMRYIFGTLRDCLMPISSSKHLADNKLLRTSFEKEVEGMVKEHLLDPLCQHIETDLRLSIHSHLQLDDRNPFNVGLSDLAPFIQMKPMKFNDLWINIKAHVEHYLDATFYNLTTVALHDWKTYGDMKHLALNKYGLHLIEADLPSQTLEQGLDVLEIMRNIHLFVSKYLYNLNNQIFIEKSSNNKYLNTINIRHIANSIRTHGIGIMNTTVNFTFQFLGKKFKIFSEFLFDEHIKSKLVKDIRFFREHHAKSDQKFPFDRAERFNRAIRKLGVMEDGSSYLDKFREVVTQIGNAMGYIRMIRSGGLHCVANAIQFIPSDAELPMTDEIPGEDGSNGFFHKLVESANLSKETSKAACNLDEVVANLVRNFAEGTEYFKMLVDVFHTSMKQHSHLNNFWIIVPPLMMNFVEHMLNAKEKLNKKNKIGAAFTDDGFVMGIAFILKLLDQYTDFDSLHWFQSVADHYEGKKKTVHEQQAKLISGSAKPDEKLQQSMNLTVRRLDTYQREFQLLDFSLSSARIFFRADKTAAEEKEEKEEKDNSSS